jgi:hypothetical protein
MANLAVLISGVGRLGNSIIQTLNAVHLAQTLGSTTILYHRYDAVDNAVLRFQGGISARKVTRSQSLKERTPQVLWRTYAMRSGALLTDPCASDFSAARMALAKGLVYKLSSARSVWPTTTLTIYLRGGDIYDMNPHPAYGQPPWAFYEKVLSLNTWGEVRLVSEDTASPVHSKIVAWCADRGVSLVNVGATLSEAVAEISRATSLVGARGTFVPAILFLAPTQRTVYLFHDSPHPLLCAATNEIVRIIDHDGAFVEAILSNNWKNSAAQRELMMSYPSSHLSTQKL